MYIYTIYTRGVIYIYTYLCIFTIPIVRKCDAVNAVQSKCQYFVMFRFHYNVRLHESTTNEVIRG